MKLALLGLIGVTLIAGAGTAYWYSQLGAAAAPAVLPELDATPAPATPPIPAPALVIEFPEPAVTAPQPPIPAAPTPMPPAPALQAAPRAPTAAAPLPRSAPTTMPSAPALPPAPAVSPAPPPPPPPPPPLPAPQPSPPATGPAVQFSCEALPFGLRVTCTIEGTAIIRQCAPDLRNWNHNLPGCNRQAATTTN